MKIEDFLSPADVIVEQPAFEKGQLLMALSQRAAASLHLTPGKIADAILKREKLGSTGVGNGIAIPHARFSEVQRPVGVLALLSKPIDFEAVDGGPVDIVFLLLAPPAPGADQLNALACIARTLRDPAVLSDLRLATDSAEAFRAITSDRGAPAPSQPAPPPS
jgi:PTS system nitrogen regulatory IIA component